MTMDKLWAQAILPECQELDAAKPSGLAVAGDAAIGQKRRAATR
ncbi:hypothetical protein [Bosea sp. F3-2]|nr:hypothetical protein [Bosea sp. F3-2]